MCVFGQSCAMSMPFWLRAVKYIRNVPSYILLLFISFHCVFRVYIQMYVSTEQREMRTSQRDNAEFVDGQLVCLCCVPSVFVVVFGGCFVYYACCALG